jgi:hypothetical protein
MAHFTNKATNCGFIIFGVIGKPQIKPIVIYDNNQNCIFLTKKSTFCVCTKYIKIHYHLM